ncbi:MAG: tetratricopeptide repeat protein [Gammaproteobacteria bacterium]
MRASSAPVEDLEDSATASTSSENQPPPATEEPDVQVRPLLGPGASQPARPPSGGEGASAAPRSGSAVVALLDNAGQQTRSGNLDAAAAALERAQRLEPRNPEVWSRLAGIRLQQGQFDQAINLASKSNSLAGNNTTLLARNNRIIVQAKQQMGKK